MCTYILTGMFKNGFSNEFAEKLNGIIAKRNSFAFVASEFESNYERTDKYFKHWLSMFEEIGIFFDNAFCVDGRMTFEQAQSVVNDSDVIWLSGGDTPKQFEYFKKYGLDKIIKNYNGIVIGMSAGSINLAKISVCSLASGHYVQAVYEGLGCVDITIEPHFSLDKTDELLSLSEKYKLFGVPDESAIILENGEMALCGDVYLIKNRKIVLL